MSKKMWRKIFKSKPQKQQQQQLNKINKRHSRGIYEEYQQLNELLSGEQHKSQSLCSENEHEIENGKNGNINVFEQQPQQSSFNSAALLSEAQQEQQQLQQQQQQQQQQQSQQLSTFSRVRNTFSLRRSSNNNNNNSNNSNNGNKKQTPNPKSTTMESDPVDNDQIHEVNELESPGPITTGASIPVPEHAAVGDLSECPCCKRTFNPNALRKHVAFCGKKRKVFDSSRQRREGTALSTYVLPKNFGLPNAEKAAGLHTPPGVSRESSSIASGGSQQLPPTDAAASPASTRRKTNTDQARATARSSLKKAAGAAAESSGAAAAPSGLTRDRMRSSDRSISKRIKDTASERCPHCERSFNPKAFDRHVEWCKEKAIQANIKAANTVETNKAKERMEARKQYRPPNLKTKRSLNRDKYSGSIEEQQQYEAEMVAQKQTLMSLSAMTSSVQSDNGISPLTNSKYDPFLSAKRQLEELCSPGTPPDNEPGSSTATHTPNATLKVTPTSMSTSLTGSLGKPQTTLTTPTTAKTTPTSNFRRTSSLRGPRRTPLLPSRPLFATNYRPTIQRGLSDEGPISTNFLKPEEYDEMPVRAACGNDFHSPRVVRRDTSASNRKQQLKLPLGVGNDTIENSSNEPKQQQPVRNVAKTDSLAVFLKYEHELEQLNAKAAEVAAISKELNSKELKDKSNNLSKQNSAKNLTTSSGQLPPLTTPVTTTSTPVTKENNENQTFNYATPLRLEPISKPSTPQLNLTTPSTGNNSSSSGVPIKLESIFGNNRLGDYIDPLLINPCDNLHVQQQAQSSTGSSNASSTPHQQLSQSRCSSQSTITMGQDQQRNSGDARNLLKRKMRLGRNQFLYDASPEEAYISSGSCADDEANRSSLEFDEQCWQQQQKQLLSNPISMPLTMPNMPPLPTFDDFDFEEFLSSFENENDEEQFPLFRDCREFLLNRTTNRQRSFQKATSTPHTQSQSQSQTQAQNQTQTPTQTKPQSQTPTTATQRATPSGISSQLIMSPSSQYYTASTKESYAHRSDSNASSKTSQSSNRSYKSMNSFDENTQKSLDDSQKREIFISIETEANAQGHSPISPQSLRHMVGNAQTPIDVLHIENGNEPEHAKFSKISDTEEDHLDAEIEDDARHVHYSKRSVLSSIPAPTLPLPNVRANNAKNEIEKRLGEFKQIGEEFGDSVRRNVLQHQEHVQQVLKCNSHLSPSPSGDSDELSSLDGYPMSSSQSSRRGASSKLSSDSAYGSSNSPISLSQRSGDKQLHISNAQRTQKQLRPHTAGGALASSSGKPASRSNKSDASTQAQTNYGTLKERQQLYAGIGPSDGQAGYSSSCSEISLPVAQPQQQQQQNSNFNYHQQQQHQHQHQQQSQVETAYNNNNNNNNNNYEHNAQNNMNNNTINAASTALASSQHSLSSNTSNGSSSMTASMKMSNYCYECGSKFMIGHAKFCVECGVKRVAL
ncbi:homeobox protein 5 isoform X2 [Drosophila sulfurigaster albostrigata]|uniref:homeobox protein 5 isoform X2 n=1 Tax=Drosophila sulfurigaster albostrigata TaxID=89887 RepID=UPI002D21AC36|nr:homeobox protein 5 isoform X2 [Drosophila sulfurigaster albostrigata]